MRERKPNFFDGLQLSKFLEKDYRQNIQDLKKLKMAIKKTKPSVVIHLAAQSSVFVSYKDPIDTIKSNVIGTMNVLETIKNEPRKNVSDLLSHLVIQGCLHLFGYNHETEGEAYAMETLEVKLLAGLGIKDPYCTSCA